MGGQAGGQAGGRAGGGGRPAPNPHPHTHLHTHPPYPEWGGSKVEEAEARLHERPEEIEYVRVKTAPGGGGASGWDPMHPGRWAGVGWRVGWRVG